MAKQVKRKFKKADTLHLQQALVVYTLLFGTDGTDGDLPDFTLKFPDMDLVWLAAFLAAINAADDAPSDDEILTHQRLATLSVKEVMALGRKRMQSMFRYADRVYEGDPKAKDRVGYPKFHKNRYNQAGLEEALEMSFTLLNNPATIAAFGAKGYPLPRIMELQLLSASLKTNNNTQEVKKSQRPVTTQERNKKMNIVWDYRVEIAEASKEVYEDDYAKQQQYLLYPEQGNDSGNPNVGTVAPGEHKVLFSGSILQPASTFDAKNSSSTDGYYIYSANTAAEPFTGAGHFVNAGTEPTGITWPMIGGEKLFVKIYNNGANPIDYVVEVV
jgi:hypothetical protein